MKNIDFKKHVAPHAIAVAVFVVLVVVFFNPVFTGKVPYQNDLLQAQGAGKDLRDYRKATGEEGLWTNSMFAGMPAYLITVEYSLDVLPVIQKVTSLGLPHPARQTFTAMLCFYIMLVVFGARPWVAILGGIAFGFSTFNILSMEAGHNAKGWAFAYMPLVLAGIRLTLKGRVWVGVALTALAMALEIRMNHLQVTYYLALVVGIYGISEIIFSLLQGSFPDLLKRGSLLLVAVLLAVGANLGRIITLSEYGNYSNRAPSELEQAATAVAQPGQLEEGQPDPANERREYAFRWSNGIWEPLTLLVPYYLGGGTVENVGPNSTLGQIMQQNGMQPQQIAQYTQRAPTYWGTQPGTGGPMYAGALVVFLFVLSLIVLPHRLRWWLLGATLLFLALSWGKNFAGFNNFMFDYFPGYNKFRAVSMAIGVVCFTLPMAGFLALEHLLQKGFGKSQQRLLFTAASITGGLALLMALFSGVFSYANEAVDANLAQSAQWLATAMQEQRQAMLQNSAYTSFFVIALSTGLIWLGLKGMLKVPVALGGVAVILVVDLFLINFKYLNAEDYQKAPTRTFFAKTKADEAILQDKSIYRVYDLTASSFNSARASYLHKSIGGYHGAKLRIYQDLIERQIQPETQRLFATFQQSQDLSSYGVLNMLNTKYLIAGPAANQVITNPNALGPAWLVQQVQVQPNAPAVMDAVGNTNTQTTALINGSLYPDFKPGSYSTQGTLEVQTYDPGHLVYQANLSGNSFVVFSEVFYAKGWKVTVNGQPANFMRVNYALRGMELPAGQHTIEWNFEPASYTTGNTVGAISSALLLLLVLGGFVMGWRQYSAELATAGGVKAAEGAGAQGVGASAATGAGASESAATTAPPSKETAPKATAKGGDRPGGARSGDRPSGGGKQAGKRQGGDRPGGARSGDRPGGKGKKR